MRNPLIKNCKTGFQDDILNRTSHYLKLLTSRSLIDNKHLKCFHSLTNNNAQNVEKERQNNNLKLMQSLAEIEMKYTRYLPGDIDASPKRKTLKNNYVEKQKQL